MRVLDTSIRSIASFAGIRNALIGLFVVGEEQPSCRAVPVHLRVDRDFSILSSGLVYSLWIEPHTHQHGHYVVLGPTPVTGNYEVAVYILGASLRPERLFVVGEPRPLCAGAFLSIPFSDLRLTAY